jgi:hypothetical protein
MAYPRKIVLNCPHGASSKLTPLVDEFIRDGVMFVAVVGKDCSPVEDLIDEIVVGDGTRDAFILTSSHPGATVSESYSVGALVDR